MDIRIRYAGHRFGRCTVYISTALHRTNLEPVSARPISTSRSGPSDWSNDGTSRLSVATLRVFGTVKTLLASMLLQVLLVTAMAWVIHPGVAVLLVLRMIPTALSHPALMATVQPRLNNESRATYLSFQNLSGRALLSGSIMLGAWAVGDTQTLDANALGNLIPY